MKAALSLFLLFASTIAFAEESRVVKQFRPLGVKKCAEEMDKLVKYFQDDESYAYLNTWNGATPPARMFATIMSRRYSDGHAITTLSVVQNSAGSCDASFTQVFPIKGTTCPELREKNFKEWKFYSDLGGTPVYEDPTTTSSSVVLINSVDGCLVVKTGTLYY